VEPALQRLTVLGLRLPLKLLDLARELGKLCGFLLARTQEVLRIQRRPVVDRHLGLGGLRVRVDGGTRVSHCAVVGVGAAGKKRERDQTETMVGLQAASG
jgi:hypothetical protein